MTVEVAIGDDNDARLRPNSLGVAILGEVRARLTTLFVPLAVVTVWWALRRIRRRHIAGEA